MIATKAYAAFDSSSPLREFSLERREPGDHDVLIEILYCGVCHSDIHEVRDEWACGRYPLVPGHEIIGRILRVGPEVKRFKPGDLAGVGCMVDSCGACRSCKEGLEQYCEPGAVFTYNSLEKDGKTLTYGGYSTQIVVKEAFTLKIAETARLEAVAPLLCAGITTYSPLRHWKIGAGHRLGVVGLGGLGHMAVKLGAAMGAEVTLISSSPSKKADALRLGAHEFLLSTERGALRGAGERFDLILDTASAPHNLARIAGLLRRDGVMVMLGLPEKPMELPTSPLIMRRKAIAGSLIGGVAETQEMLDFCAERGITSDVELIPIQEINTAYDRMMSGDVRYRFVIDLASLR